MANYLIFIPDISGFTRFTNNTEINHSGHIVSDLLEIILSKNQLGLTLSEVEGDALLFVKKDEMPSVTEVIEQANEMYRAFHEHLLNYKTNRVCDCGACTSAPELTLKFFAHQGELVKLKVGELTKFHGSEMILAHRLMKNNIESDDYLLLSDTFDIEGLSSHKIESGFTEFPHLGKVDYHFLDLVNLREGLKPQSFEIEPIENGYEGESLTDVLDVPLERLLRDLGDLSVKEEMLSELVNVQRTQQSMNFVGNEHVCIVGGKSINFVTAGFQRNGEEYVLTEQVLNAPFIAVLHKVYTVSAVSENRSKITTKFAYKLRPGIIPRMLRSIFEKKFLQGSLAELELMKKFYRA